MTSSAVIFSLSLLSFLAQLLALMTIPFLVFLIVKRTYRGFWRWMGLKRAPLRAVWIGLAAASILAAIKLPLMIGMLSQEGTVSGELLRHYLKNGLSIWLLGTLLVSASLKTALTEELFFRGFVGTRLIAWLGFRRGNAIQALAFGALHAAFVLALPEQERTITLRFVLFLGPGIGAWIMGYLNHRLADDSIAPSWAMHAFGNTVAYAAPLALAGTAAPLG